VTYSGGSGPVRYHRARRIARLAFSLGVLVVVCAVAAVVVFFQQRQHQALRAAAQTRQAEKSVSRPQSHYLGAVMAKGGRFSQFEAAAGVHPNLTAMYIKWGTPLPVGPIVRMARQHIQTMIVLLPEPTSNYPTPVSLQSILAHQNDEYLRTMRRAIRDLHIRILLSFGPEMNGTWYPWAFMYDGHPAATPRQYVDAYRYVHDFIGTKDVTWVWQVSHGFHKKYLSSENIRKVWPGPKYVNMIGVDGYYEQHGDSYYTLFNPVVRQIHHFAPGKPVLIAETAIGPVTDQARRIPTLFDGVQAQKLAGFIWFDINQVATATAADRQQAGYLVHHQDWMLRPNSKGAQTFTQDACAAAWSRPFVTRPCPPRAG